VACTSVGLIFLLLPWASGEATTLTHNKILKMKKKLRAKEVAAYHLQRSNNLNSKGFLTRNSVSQKKKNHHVFESWGRGSDPFLKHDYLVHQNPHILPLSYSEYYFKHILYLPGYCRHLSLWHSDNSKVNHTNSFAFNVKISTSLWTPCQESDFNHAEYDSNPVYMKVIYYKCFFYVNIIYKGLLYSHMFAMLYRNIQFFNEE
jgi:hypothetical protein